MPLFNCLSPRWLLSLMALIGFALPQPTAGDDTFSQLGIVPAEITLTGPRARQQLLVTGQAATQVATPAMTSGSPLEADLTRRVTFESSATLEFSRVSFDQQRFAGADERASDSCGPGGIGLISPNENGLIGGTFQDR